MYDVSINSFELLILCAVRFLENSLPALLIPLFVFAFLAVGRYVKTRKSYFPVYGRHLKTVSFPDTKKFKIHL